MNEKETQTNEQNEAAASPEQENKTNELVNAWIKRLKEHPEGPAKALRDLGLKGLNDQETQN